jgi:hypothetical protein
MAEKMSGENIENEKDCISQCLEEFMDCVEFDRPECVVAFQDCSGSCER